MTFTLTSIRTRRASSRGNLPPGSASHERCRWPLRNSRLDRRNSSTSFSFAMILPLRRWLVRGLAPAFLFVATSVALAALPAGITQGPTVEGIAEYTLANGLKVLLFPDPSQQKTTVNITYLVGSRHENYGETGMAHLLEHMMFKGTPT